MKLSNLVAGVGAALAASVGSAAWAQSGEMSPAGAWELKQTAESCYLVRSFEGGGRKIQVFVQSFGYSTPYVIALTGDGLPLRDQRSEAVEIGFGGQEVAKTILGVVGKAGGQPAVVFTGEPPHPTHSIGWLYYGTKYDLHTRVDPSAETLFIDAVDMEPMTFRLGAMETEYARLDECGRALESQWAAAASGDAPPATQPKLLQGKEAAWRTKYPENLLLNRISGLTHVRMTVGVDGRARDCVVQAFIWAKRFGEEACSKLQQWARFEPAKDDDGKPVRALYRTSAMFVIYDW